MATLNVQTDYGAAGDGQTDDTQAINSAIADAGPGDTVYLPAGTYLVDQRSSPSNTGTVMLYGSDSVDDLTVKGDGEETVLLQATSQPDQWIRSIKIDLEDAHSADGLVLKEFVVDMQRSNQDDPDQGHGMAFRDPGGPTDVLLENIHLKNTIGTGVRNDFNNVTVRWCTFENTYGHGWGTTGSTDNYTRIESCLFVGVSKRGYYGIDANYGDFDVKNCVSVDHPKGQGMKTTSNTKNVTMENCRFARSAYNGFQRGDDAPGETTVTLINCVFEDNERNGIRPSYDTTYEIPAGEEIVCTNNGMNGVLFANDANAAFDGTVYSNNNGDYALYNSGDATGYVADIQHADNGSGLKSEGVDVQSTGSDVKTDLAGVPTADEVGAWAGDTSGGETGGGDEETHRTDFGEDSPGTTPANWTPRASSSNDNWNVVQESSGYGSQALEFDASADAAHALQWDNIPATTSDVEVLQLVRVPSLSDGDTVGRIRARFDGTGYTADIGSGRFQIYDAGTGDRLATGGNPEPDTWYWMRFRLAGDTLKLKAWQYGSDEPTDWTLEATDSTYSSGWVGVGSYQATRTEWSWVSAGLNGASAPKPVEETHKTDFGEDSPGTTPANWTPRASSSDDNWNVVQESSGHGSQALEFDASADAAHALQWDNIPATTSDVEVLQLVRVPSLSDSDTVGRIRARFDGTGYTADIGVGQFQIYDTNTGNRLATGGNPEPDTWYWMRFRLAGDTLKLKAWQYGSDEPATWLLEATDSTYSSGWVGVGSYQATRTEWSWVSAGLNGASAPKPEQTIQSGAIIDAGTGAIRTSGGVIDTR